MDEVLNIAVEFWRVLAAMSPYLLFGFLVAGLLSVFISPQPVERQLGGGGIAPVFKAALFGVPLPLCSCGVIPVSASLRRHGASRGATTAFLISTPQTGVDSIFVTFSLLGPVFAVFRPLVALVSGALGGLIVSATGGEDVNKKSGARRSADEIRSPVTDGDGNRLKSALRYGFLTLPRDIGKALLIGLVIAGVISALVPKNYFAGQFGPGVVQILVLMALGIPIYVCATASVPVALALIGTGVTPGAALAFLMTGPATNAAAITTIWKIMGKRTTIVYLLTVAVAAFCAGVLLDAAFPGLAADVQSRAEAHHDTAAWRTYVESASAVALLAVLGLTVLKPMVGQLGGPASGESHEHSLTLSIAGMTCSHCVSSVTRALREQPGVASVTVDLKSGRAVVGGTGFETAALCRAVDELGYTAGVNGNEKGSNWKEANRG